MSTLKSLVRNFQLIAIPSRLQLAAILQQTTAQLLYGLHRFDLMNHKLREALCCLEPTDEGTHLSRLAFTTAEIIVA